VVDVQQTGRECPALRRRWEASTYRESAGPKRAARLSLVPAEPFAPAIETHPEVAGTRRLLAAVAAVQSWEGEDGLHPLVNRI
jgi:hypothetical protein